MRQRDMTITPARFLFAFSEAMELATPTLARHQLRVAYLVGRLALSAGLPAELRERVFLAALIHDLGALTPEEKEFNHEQTLRPAELRRHGELGFRLLRHSAVLDKLAPLIHRHHAPYRPGDENDPERFASNLLHLGEIVEHFVRPDVYILEQRPELLRRLGEAAPALAGPRALELFLDASAPEAFWLDFASPRLAELLASAIPFGRRVLEDGEIWDLGETFRRLVDFRSHFTATHSAGVVSAAGTLARLSGFSPDETRWMRFAGCMHDAGKMAVPSAILEKPGPLDEREMAVMRQHTYHTARLLERAGVGPRVVEWAAFHHERLDGRGYPFRASADAISLGSRLMTVADIFTALAEDRPYRAGLPRERVVAILRDMAKAGAVDAGAVERVDRHYDEIADAARREQGEAAARFWTATASL